MWLNNLKRNTGADEEIIVFSMDNERLYEIARIRRNEFYSTKPDYIEEADIFPLVHDNTEGDILGWIEVFLNTGSAYASYNVVEISRDYTDEQSCKKAKEEVTAYLTDYFDKTFCEDEIKRIWQYVESGNLKWQQFTRYLLSDSSYKEDVFELYATIKLCEIAIYLKKPEEVKKVKLIPYFEDWGYYDDDTFATLSIFIDARIEKEDEYTQLVWTGTADGYNEEKSKEKAEEVLAFELYDNLKRILSDEEVQNFWEDVPWNRNWKKIEKG